MKACQARGMLSTNSLFVAAQVVALSTVFHLIPQFPFSVWSLAPNTVDFPPDLQLWRSLGKYHLFLHKPSSRSGILQAAQL